MFIFMIILTLFNYRLLNMFIWVKILSIYLDASLAKFEQDYHETIRVTGIHNLIS